MKERIVISRNTETSEYYKKFPDRSGKQIEHIEVLAPIEQNVRFEQVPETWQELKELCKKINSKIVNENAMYESQIIIDTDKGYFGFYYYSTGRIDIVFKSAYSINHTVAKRRTIPQTWDFIKSLIGEE